MELTKEKYQNILKMLKSSDSSNHTLGLSLLETVPFKEHAAAMLLLKKHSNIANTVWHEHAPSIYVEFGNIPNLDLTKPVTYKQILQIITKEKLSPEQLAFYMDDFSAYLLEQIQAIGYDYVKGIEIKIKTDSDE
jgi:pterin-4a-carbinolamine dehydratase